MGVGWSSSSRGGRRREGEKRICGSICDALRVIRGGSHQTLEIGCGVLAAHSANLLGTPMASGYNSYSIINEIKLIYLSYQSNQPAFQQYFSLKKSTNNAFYHDL